MTRPFQSTALDDYFSLGHLETIKSASAEYYCQRFLGKGGNGTAFLVTCGSGKHLGLQMVLKVFHKISDTKRQKAFLREIALLKQINHPAIIKVYDEGVTKGRSGKDHPFALIEFMPRTVRQLLVEDRIDRLAAIRIALNCLSALNSIHTLASPLIHRDIKPENILISEAGPKLADFGLVKVLGDLSEEPTETHVEEPAIETQWPGMPIRYRTPELITRAQGTSGVSTASDIYQFGIVFYELLTGINPQRPVDRQHILDPIALHIKPIFGSQGVAISELIRKMLDNQPNRRPTAQECLVALNKIHIGFCEDMKGVTGQNV